MYPFAYVYSVILLPMLLWYTCMDLDIREHVAHLYWTPIYVTVLCVSVLWF